MTQTYLQSTERLAIKLLRTGNFTDCMVVDVVGIPVTLIRKLRKKFELPKVKRLGERSFLSSIHWRIGNRLLALRMFGEELSPVEISLHLGWTEQKYTRVERGKYLLSVIDLELLAEHFSCSINDIINCHFGNLGEPQ